MYFLIEDIFTHFLISRGKIKVNLKFKQFVLYKIPVPILNFYIIHQYDEIAGKWPYWPLKIEKIMFIKSFLPKF